MGLFIAFFFIDMEFFGWSTELLNPSHHCKNDSTLIPSRFPPTHGWKSSKGFVSREPHTWETFRCDRVTGRNQFRLYGGGRGGTGDGGRGCLIYPFPTAKMISP